jgi:hypothetical protein
VGYGINEAMARVSHTAFVLIMLGGCSLGVKPPPVPDGYPKLGEYDDGKAELMVDGEHYVSDFSLGATYNPEGGYDDELRLSLDLDALRFELRDLEVDEFTVSSGDLEARYDYSFTADGDCGDGRVDVVGIRTWDSGILGDQQVMWGTVQVELCDGNEPAALDVSGRFSAVITEL